MDSLEPLSCAAIRRRLNTLIAESAHLRKTLPPDSPHNAVLRLSDVARYIRVPALNLQRAISEKPSRHLCRRGCATLYDCERDSRCDTLAGKWQLELSRFFWALDRGNIRKIRVGDEWRIENSHKGDGALPQVVPAPLPTAATRKPFELRIDLTKLGPKLEVK